MSTLLQPRSRASSISAFSFPRGNLLPHIYNTSDTVACFHIIEGVVDTSQILSVCNELIDL